MVVEVTYSRRVHFHMEGTYWGKADLRWWGCVIEWHVREGSLGQKHKTELPELSFGKKIQGGCFLGGGNPIGARYTKFEVAGGCNWVRCNGALVGPKTQNQAAGAQFWRMKCRRAVFWAEGIQLG